MEGSGSDEALPTLEFLFSNFDFLFSNFRFLLYIEHSLVARFALVNAGRIGVRGHDTLGSTPSVSDYVILSL